MALGALLLEGDNYEFWVALGCLSGYNALRQHALIRGLQLDVSLAIAWAYLGKVLTKNSESLLLAALSLSLWFIYHVWTLDFAHLPEEVWI